MSWQKIEPTRHRVTVAGVVTDAETGKPLRGVQVDVTTAPDAFTTWLDIHARQFENRWETLTERPDRKRSAADGHFHFLDLPLGEYTLTASLTGSGSRYGLGSVTVTVPEADGEPPVVADVALPSTALGGRIIRIVPDPEEGEPSEQPVPMARVLVRGSGEQTFSDTHETESLRGRYLLNALEAGRRTIEVSAQGYAPATGTVELVGGTKAELDFELAAT